VRATPRGPRGRALQGRDNIVVRTLSCSGTLPGLAIRVADGGKRVGQSPVNPPAVLLRRRLVDGRTHQRVAHGHGFGVSEQQAELHCGVEQVHTQSERGSCAPDDGSLAGLVGGDEQQQQLHVAGQPAAPVHEHLLDACGQV
jgi:hypothetical protein